MNHYEDQIQDIGVTACTQLFESYGVSLVREAEPVTPRSKMRYCGVIKFTGENIDGTLGLASPHDLLGKSDPARVGARDWVGELANQLAGRVKHRLLAHSVEVNYSTPVVLRAEQLRLRARTPVRSLWFKSEDGCQLCLWLDLDLEDRFEMAGEPDAEKAGLPEGDFLMF
jgi:hypothetical protein